ncbi:MAG: class I SAM-dependent methyltransferase [Oscillospiraceae bacterium]|nr:class I SAM-dependent methyltransferase [Oscillospiraceae bacterium]
MKITIENIKAEYSIDTLVDKFVSSVDDIGLWQSERLIFSEYLNLRDKILDLGCGAGRTTFGLFEMGYRGIIGLDLSDGMIAAALDITKSKNLLIPFIAGNACELTFDSASFDAVIFSFNGIMTIPTSEMRQKAFDEIYRVLKPGGIFIFTAHYMDNPQFVSFWKTEREKWDKGEQDKRLLEYGDVIFSKPDEYGDIISFVHIPVAGEIESYLSKSGYNIIFNKARSKFCEENAAVMGFSGDCKFWVCKK